MEPGHVGRLRKLVVILAKQDVDLIGFSYNRTRSAI